MREAVSGNKPMAFRCRQLSCWLTIFVAALLSLPALAKSEAQIQAEYLACQDRAKLELTAPEKDRIKAFRLHLSNRVGPLRADDSLSGIKRYSEALIQAIEDGVTPEEVTTRLDSRFKFAIREEKLRRVIAQSLREDHATYKAYMKLAIGAVYKQKFIDIDEFNRLHQDLLTKLSVHYMNENDRALGLKVPLSLTMARPEDFALAYQITNEVSEIVAELQAVNAIVTNDRAAFKKALAWQAVYAVGGTLAFMSTFALGPVAVARGGLIAVQLGYRALSGARVAGMGVGGIGTPGALAPLTAYMTVTEAYRRSSELGTPVRCELDRSADLANFGGKMMGAAAFGTGVGLVGVSAVGLSMATLRVTGVMAKGSMTYAGGMAAIEGAQGFHYCSLAKQLRALENVPENLQSDREALAKLAENECMARLQSAGAHAIETATIFALYRELYLKGHLKEAVEHGVEKAMGVMAYSADSLPTALKTTADATAGTARGVARMTGLTAQPVIVPLAVQIRLFMEKFPNARAAVEVPQFEWHFAIP